jgi:tRNA-specific 2-thiouridylase
VVVGPRTAGRTGITLGEVNWLIDPPAAPRACTVKLRARDTLRQATLHTQEGVTYVDLAEPALPAPGQACVFYDGDRILGGGFIEAQARPGARPLA